MPRYIEIDEQRLAKLHDGLELLEELDRDAMRDFDLHIYGISTNPQLIDSARESIAESEELAEEDVQLVEIAVAIPINADTIYALKGSGIRMTREEFAYMGSGGEGIRSLSFVFGHYKPKIVLPYLSRVAIASSGSWLDDFLRKYGTGQAAAVTPAVHRTEEATQPGVPPAPAPKTTLSSLLDNFLS